MATEKTEATETTGPEMEMEMAATGMTGPEMGMEATKTKMKGMASNLVTRRTVRPRIVLWDFVQGGDARGVFVRTA